MDNHIIMNLQLFADDPQSGGDNGGGATEPTTKGGQQNQQSQQSTEQIVTAVLSAMEERQKRAGNVVMKSMAEQYGMKPEELTALLDAEKQKNANKLSPEAQAQVDAANAKMHEMQLSIDVSKLGEKMGMIDADAVLALLDKSKIKYTDKGVEGTQAALDALKAAKPALFGKAAQGGAWGQQRKGGAPGDGAPTTLLGALQEKYHM